MCHHPVPDYAHPHRQIYHRGIPFGGLPSIFCRQLTRQIRAYMLIHGEPDGISKSMLFTTTSFGNSDYNTTRPWVPALIRLTQSIKSLTTAPVLPASTMEGVQRLHDTTACNSFGRSESDQLMEGSASVNYSKNSGAIHLGYNNQDDACINFHQSRFKNDVAKGYVTTQALAFARPMWSGYASTTR